MWPFEGIHLDWPIHDWGWAIRAFLAHFGLGFLTAFILHRIFSKLISFGNLYAHHPMGFYRALWCGFFGGVASVVIDLDHATLFFNKNYTRLAHKPLAYFSAALIFYCVIKIFKAENRRTDKYLCLALWAFCLIVHVWEDFTYGWF